MTPRPLPILVRRILGITESVGLRSYLTSIYRVYTSPASSTVIPYDDPNLTGTGPTTNRLGAGTGSFVAGKISEDGTVNDFGWTANNYTELLYSLKFVKADLANGDTLRFRVLRNGATTGMTYTQTPRVDLTMTFVPPKTGTATTAHAWAPSASGKEGPGKGTASVSHSWAPSASGKRTPKGAGVLAHADALAGAGKKIPKAAATTAHAWPLTASGTRPVVSPKQGSATTTWSMSFSAGAPIVKVQSVTNHSGSGNYTLTLPSNVTVGNYIIVTGAAYQDHFAQPTDSRGHTYTQAGAEGIANGILFAASWFTKVTSAGPCTVTTSASNGAAAAAEFSGLADSSVLSDSDNVTGTGTTLTAAATGVLPQANCLVIGHCTHGFPTNPLTLTEDPAFLLLGEEEDNLSYQAFNAQYKITSSTASVTPTWTCSHSDNWVTQRHVFLGGMGGTTAIGVMPEITTTGARNLESGVARTLESGVPRVLESFVEPVPPHVGTGTTGWQASLVEPPYKYLTPTVGMAVTADPGPLPADVTITAKLRKDSFTQGHMATVAAQMGFGPYAWRLHFHFGGGFAYGYSTDGSGFSDLGILTSAELEALFDVGTDFYLGAVVSTSNDTLRAITSANGATWTVAGPLMSGPLVAPFDNDARLEIGRQHEGTQHVFDGRIYWVECRTDPGGALVWRFDAKDYPGSGTQWIDSHGRTWDLSAAGAITEVVPTGTLALGKRTSQGAATTTFTEAVTAAGKKAPKGAATAAHAWAPTAAGKRTPASSATVPWTEAPAATGKRTPKGSITAAHSWVPAASGVKPVVPPRTGSATVTHAWSLGVLGDSPPNRGAATGAWSTSLAASGKKTTKGTATTTSLWVPVAAGSRASRGTSTVGWHELLSTVGKRTPKGAPTSIWTVVPTAAGKKAPKSTLTTAFVEAVTAAGRKFQQGTATTSWFETLAAAGRRIPQSTVTATWTTTLGAVGRRIPQGIVTAAHNWVPTAAGVKPIVGVNQGTAIVGWTEAVTAAGKKSPRSVVTTTYTETVTAAGRKNQNSTVTVPWYAALVSVGKRTPKSTGTVTALQTLSSVGRRTPKAQAAAVHAWTPSAIGVKPVVNMNQGTGLVAVSWAPAAVGKRSPKGTSIPAVFWTPVATGKKIQQGSATTNYVEAVPPAPGKKTQKSAVTTTVLHTIGAAGRRTSSGSATAAHTWTPAAAGFKPLVGVKQGFAITLWTASTTAAGRRVPKGAPTVAHLWTPVATGKKIQKGTAAANYVETPTSAGKRSPKSTAVTAYTETLTAAGKRSPKGAGAAVGHTWNLFAQGLTPALAQGAGLATTSWTPTAAGKRAPKGSSLDVCLLDTNGCRQEAPDGDGDNLPPVGARSSGQEVAPGCRIHHLRRGGVGCWTACTEGPWRFRLLVQPGGPGPSRDHRSGRCLLERPGSGGDAVRRQAGHRLGSDPYVRG